MNLPNFGQIGERLVGRFFRKVDNVVWDLTSGRVGIITGDGEISTLSGEGDAAEINISPFAEFGMPVPAFAQSVPVDSIKQGDLIYNAKRALGWVIGLPNLSGAGKKTRTFKLLKADGTRGEWVPAKIASMGLDLSGAMVLRSLVNMLPGDGLSGFQGMLLPMLMMGGDMGGDLEQMMPMLLMSQMGMIGGTPGTATNPMGGMFQMMLMMKMIGGGKGNEGSPGRSSGSFFDR